MANPIILSILAFGKKSKITLHRINNPPGGTPRSKKKKVVAMGGLEPPTPAL